MTKTWKWIAVGLVLAVWAAGISVALARSVCGDHDGLVAYLAENHDESRTALALDSSGNVIELFTAPDGATWTMLFTSPDGPTCVMSLGEGWVDLPRSARIGDPT